MEVTSSPELFLNLAAVADYFKHSTGVLKECLTYLNFEIHEHEGQELVEFEGAFVVAIRFFSHVLTRVWIVHDLWCGVPPVQERWKEKDLWQAAGLLAFGDRQDDDQQAAREAVECLMSKNRLVVCLQYLTLTRFPFSASSPPSCTSGTQNPRLRGLSTTTCSPHPGSWTSIRTHS